jgi:sulfate/thiosulfate transport system substrate-binding protein
MRGIMKSNRWLLLALLGLLVTAFAAACGGDDEDASGADSSAAAPAEGSSAAAPAGSGEAAGGGGKLTLVAYSTPKEAYEAVIPAFQATPAGQGTTFEQSYGASGDQSRAVVSGLPADIAAFSLEPDITRLTDEGLVDADWNAGANKGMVTDSVVVLVVRKGNPDGIKTWDDLVKPGVEVISPNPFISGGARWNVMAAYGAQIKAGKTEDEAKAYLEKLFHQIVVQPKSARDALNAFVEGKGDVMIGYENEAITAQQKGEEVDYVIPDQTILIENPIAVVNTSKNAAAAKAFVDFAISPEGQKLFAEKGYRPVDATVAQEFADTYPTPSGLFTIADVGGWPEVMKTFFDKDAGIVAEINKNLGVPLEG